MQIRAALGVFGALAMACGGTAGPGNPHRPPPSPEYRGPGVQSPSFGTATSAPVLEAAMHYPAMEIAAEPPVSLTAPDGTGLALETLHARAVVDGPLAFTEMHLVFRNPSDRVIEGRFQITLPDAAAISRFAMKIDGGWMEAEVVEKMAARQAYEDFLHRRTDPALLESAGGNQFRARIFPIPANGEKHIILSYSQDLPSSDEPYRLPLVGWPKMKQLDVAVRRGAEVSRLSKTDFEPTADFTVSQRAAVRGMGDGHLAVVRVAPNIDASPAPVAGVLVLVDTSASRALGYAAYVERLGSVVRALRDQHSADLPLRVAAFDQGVHSVFDGTAGDFGKAQLDALLARRPLGASNLHDALTWAASHAHPRVVVVTDGIATAGPTDVGDLTEAVKALAPTAERLDVVLTGGIRDEAAMTRLARGNLARDGVVVDGALSADRIATQLGTRTVSGIDVRVAGAEWAWPARLDGVQPGDEVLVYAKLAKPAKRVEVSLGGPIDQTERIDLVHATPALLERAAVMAHIAHLEHTGGADARERIVALSTKHRVLSEHTALLVLETEQDYARFGIDRKSLTDILVVGEAGVEVINRTTLVLPAQQIAATGKDTDATLADKKGEASKQLTGDVERKPDDQASFGGATAAENDYRVDDAPTEGVGASGSAETITVTGNAPRAEEPRVSTRAPMRLRTGPAARPPPSPEPEAAERAYDFDGDADEASAEGHAYGAAAGRAASEEVEPQRATPYSGKFAEVMKQLAAGEREQALIMALRWRADDPGDVMALVALGEALEANGNTALAARAYGSIIDLFPTRADMRRFAGQRLERLGSVAAPLAVDTYARAVEQRPDHPSSHRLYAYALARAGKLDDAVAAMDAALSRSYPGDRFAGVQDIMRDDLGLLAAAWIAAAPDARTKAEAVLSKHSVRRATKPSTRFVMTWETDANDVDLHIWDAAGNHASYQNKDLASGGRLYADVTTGFGPEAIVIDGPAKAGPYRLQAHYYSRGPMGYGMGTMDVIRHDGRGGLTFEHHPFLIMVDDGWVDLGTVK